MAAIGVYLFRCLVRHTDRRLRKAERRPTMSCKNEKHKTIDRDDAQGSARRQDKSRCPCGDCPRKAKWVCMAGLAAGLGLVALRALRRATASA